MQAVGLWVCSYAIIQFATLINWNHFRDFHIFGDIALHERKIEYM